ncbi:hypothetical protein JCGZ_07266 [Jatropha curcas]|uniref:RanBP2-type domain-containing protein n=1 Tax=Jatropha curcas TaxID=180498 RepID=A0A067KN46_JATCU|nr:hypothetical protein JCGZ_07266 [Jatropha curcas]
MGSRDKDQTTSHHQPLLSSLVVRPSVSDGGDGGGGGRGGGSDYEPGEVRRDPPPYSRQERYSDDPALNIACKNLGLEEGMLVEWCRNSWGACVSFCCESHCLVKGYRIHAGSGSPARRRDADHRYGSDFDHSGVPPRGREFGSGRDPGRFRDSSPPYARGRVGGRPPGRGFDGPGFGPGSFRGEGMSSRNNPNVRPREGDWICSDPLCGNLNFARREYCNNCKRPRYGPGGSPRRGYPGPPPPHAPPRRFPGPPLDLSPSRNINGYRSPPRGWGRDGPRDFGPGAPPPPRHGGRFSDQEIRRGRPDFPDDDYRGRNKFDRPIPVEWDVRERSRSPIRGAPPVKDYRRDMYMERGRDDRRGMGRDRIGDVY